jgi:predicted transcriptional regulator
MADDSTAQMVDLSLVAEIVRSYVAQNSVGVDQVAGLIATVHRSLSGLVQSSPASPPVPLVPAVPIRRSVQRHHVVCLECGYHAQMLRRHLRIAHDLEVADYRTRWKLPADHPITAPAYSERRSTMAKQIGLGRKPKEAVVSPPEVDAPPPKRRGRKPRSTAAEYIGTRLSEERTESPSS